MKRLIKKKFLKKSTGLKIKRNIQLKKIELITKAKFRLKNNKYSSY